MLHGLDPEPYLELASRYFAATRPRLDAAELAMDVITGLVDMK